MAEERDAEAGRLGCVARFKDNDFFCCNLTETEFRNTVDRYVAEPFVTRLPRQTEQINEFSDDELATPIAHFEFGLWLPLWPEIVQILKYFGVTLAQLTPNAVSIMVAFACYLREERMEFSLPAFRKLFFFRAFADGTNHFAGNGVKVRETAKKSHYWTQKFLRVRGPFDGVPFHPTQFGESVYHPPVLDARDQKLFGFLDRKNFEVAYLRRHVDSLPPVPLAQIINVEIFKSLQEIHGCDFQEFMFNKLIPVKGDMTKAKMGIDAAMAEEISQEVDIIVHSAANTTFDERYDVALDINTIGTFRMMRFAKTFKRLKVFLHVSTAYVNGTREGRVLEKPFSIGDSITKELADLEDSGESMPLLNIQAEIQLALSSKKASNDAFLVQKMKDLGLERANIYGWQDVYVFTKAMAEMVVNSMRDDIPVVTIRPSVIESTWKEPFPGWIEGNRMVDPLILYYGKGQLNGFLGDPKGVLDVVPVDMVVNAILAAIAKHGWVKKSGIHTYHIASSIVNPLVIEQLSTLIYRHFNSLPYIDSKGRPIEVRPVKLFDDLNEFSDQVHSNVIQMISLHEKMSEKISIFCLKLVDQAKYLAYIYKPYVFYRGRFDNTNTQKLIDEMSEEERIEYCFDVGEVDWEDYIPNIHIPGLRRHVMKGRGI